MKNLLTVLRYCAIIMLLGFGLAACSDSTPNNNSNNKPNVDTEATNPQNINAGGTITKSSCKRPENVILTNADYQNAGNYILTYSWDAVENATGYEFELFVNGTAVFQNLSVQDTFITFPQSIASSETIHAAIRTVCGATKSPSSKESSQVVYKNAIATDDLIFLVKSTTTVDDICAATCDKLKFESLTFLNSNGTAITLANFAMQVYFYDFNTIKTCIQCNGSSAPVVDPVAFNNCLNSPLNEYWIYDPGAYEECPE